MKFNHPGSGVGTEMLFVDPTRKEPYTLRRAVIAQKSSISLGYHLLVYNDPEIDCKYGRPATEIAYDVELIANEAAFPHPNARVAWPNLGTIPQLVAAMQKTLDHPPAELSPAEIDSIVIKPTPTQAKELRDALKVANAEPGEIVPVTTPPASLSVPDIRAEFTDNQLVATEDVKEKVPVILVGSRGFCMVAAKSGTTIKYLGGSAPDDPRWVSELANAVIFETARSARATLELATQPFIDKIAVAKRGRGRPKKT